MREIIFRGKHVWRREWVYGDLINDKKFRKVSIMPYSLEGLPFSEWVVEVDPSTVGQYTGYREEKSGKMLFDGDNFLVQTWEDDGRESLAYYTVCWDDEGLRWMAKSLADPTYDEPLADVVDSTLEIIGNIHDQKEDV